MNKKVELNTYSTSIRLKVAEMRNDNSRLEQLIVAKKLEIKELEKKLNSIQKSKIFWIWQLYCNIREIFFGNGRKKRYSK